MTDNFPRCLAAVLKHEGGYVDHPKDPGGATNLGVTMATLAEWKGRPVTKAEVKALTPPTVAPIYRQRYWLAASCDKLPPGLDYMAFDLAVNSGVGRATKYIQRAAGVTEDGHIGPQTLAAVNRLGAKVMVGKVSGLRDCFYRALPTFPTFGKGWMRRLNEVTAQALAWAER